MADYFEQLTTPARKASEQEDWLDAAADLGRDRLNSYALFERYYDGEQRTRLPDRAREYLEASGLKFCENFSEVIVDVMAERLTVTGFDASIDGEEEADTEAEDLTASEEITAYASKVWEQNRMDAVQGIVHTQFVMKGDAAVIVDWDVANARPRITYNRPESVGFVYAADEPDQLAYAVKCWATREDGRAIERLNVYWPDRIEKWYRLHTKGESSGGWIEYPVEGEPWPLPWTRGDGSARGIPIIHFRNRPLGNAYGRSELRGVLPLQDELNKQALDLNLILDSQAWAQRWVTGFEGDNASLKHVPGDVWSTQSVDAKFGQFDPSDVSGVLAAIESTLSRMARRSRTPLHLLLGGDMPSGEALRSAESGLVAKVEDRSTSLGNAWEDAMRMALRLAEDNGELPVPLQEDVLTLATQWKDPQSRNEEAEIARAEGLLRIGVSKATILAELGFNAEREAERKKEEGGNFGAGLLAAFDRGEGEDNGGGLG